MKVTFRDLVGVFSTSFWLFLIIGLVVQARLEREYINSYDVEDYHRGHKDLHCGSISLRNWNKTYVDKSDFTKIEFGLSTVCLSDCGIFPPHCRTEKYSNQFDIRAGGTRSVPRAFCDSNQDVDYCRGYFKREEEIKNG